MGAAASRRKLERDGHGEEKRVTSVLLDSSNGLEGVAPHVANEKAVDAGFDEGSLVLSLLQHREVLATGLAA